ncbi:8-oxo-dGTP pyrophosphatase MutT and related house-cleaning NTP pyrophosphohydrolases [Commensalibacter communis]|uniref:NUDIX domain-containing protein n=1 Tax=Commensalibacter communis TaxID=2972786 RepID=UPI0022FF7677|nr:NUDIX hydrolase [Commensalibacter communis]CAI3926971.1 8-oxo-dGTP pyrophosphatase MutT and related house-cleaning NTP pyrophosphohydrolases [Commensalibacter communis]CAI3932211.1 8-oxo-dGTP pyrophosphatase MutT and related house-cleaning NTP pyrophosphohydrolases [Commensalibacter communis]
MSKMTLKKTRTLWDGHSRLEMTEMLQQYEDGHIESLKREVLKARDSVVVLLYRQDTKKLVLTSQWRAPTVFRGDNRPVIEACAGNIDQKDFDNHPKDALAAAKTAAIREVEEETGWHIAQLDYLYALYSCPGISTEKLYYFIASVDEKVQQGGGVRDEGEDIAVLEISLQEAITKIQEGEIMDLKTVVLIQYIQLHCLDYLE